jgi:magnesium transporter
MLIIRRPTDNGLEEVGRDSVIDLLRRRDSNVWFHCDAPNDDELRFLQEHLKIHDLTVEDIVNQNQRPKLESFDDYVYLAIHLLLRKNMREIEPSELDLLVGSRWIVTVHYGPVTGIIDNSHLHERIPRALRRGVDLFLYTLLDLVVDAYFPLLDEIEEEVDSLQDRLVARADNVDLSRLLSLKRSLIHIRRAVSPQREVLSQLIHDDFPFIQPGNRVYFRDVYDHLVRIIEELDTLREILSSTLEIHLASTSNQLNITMKRLMAWGTIFVVITAIAGIYGMNFKFMPELEWRYGYFAILGFMALVSAGLYFYFKKTGSL